MTRDERFLRQAFPEEAEFAPRLARLQKGEPLAYLLGEWDFYDLTFSVSPACLIPRPDTEHLAEYLIRHLPPNAFFADLCTGSGCIAVTVLHHRPDTRAVAVDVSADALAIAIQNACRNGVADRFTPILGNVLQDHATLFSQGVPQWIVCNPPYIASAVVDTLDESVRAYEPRLALDGGADGLDFYRCLLTHYLPQLPPEGKMVLEIGYDQGQALRDLTSALCPARHCTVYPDYAKNDRMAVLT